jgi:hypothetical protein
MLDLIQNWNTGEIECRKSQISRRNSNPKISINLEFNSPESKVRKDQARETKMKASQKF